MRQIVDGAYCIPQASVYRVDKAQVNRVKSRKTDFVETYLLKLLRHCVLILQFLMILLSYKQKYRADRKLSNARGPRHLKRT